MRQCVSTSLLCGALAGRDPAEVYDIEAIADEVLITTGTGHLYRYVFPDDPDVAPAVAGSNWGATYHALELEAGRRSPSSTGSPESASVKAHTVD